MRAIKQITVSFLLTLFVVGQIACGGEEDAQVADISPTSTEPLIEQTPEAEITFGEMALEVEQIDTETITQNNCGGSDRLENEIEKRRTITHQIEVGASYEVNANGEVGLPGDILSVGLGAAITGQFGYAYGFSEEIARAIRVSASPGTNMQHEISLQEVWKVGEAEVLVNGQAYRIPFRYRSSFSIELIGSQDLGDCPATATVIPLSAEDVVEVVKVEEATETPTPVEPTATPTPTPTATDAPDPTAEPISDAPQNEIVVLSENSDNTYNWKNGAPNVTTQLSFEGSAAFIPTGNNSFEEEVATVGYEPDEVRYVNLRLYLLREEAGFLLQVKLDGNDWEHRWGFDGRGSYQGAYTYNRRGQTLNMPVGEWVEVELDLINDLGARPGQVIRGMAFSAADGNMVYDYVTLTSSRSLTTCLPPTVAQADGAIGSGPELVVLANTQDNTYTWEQGSPYVSAQLFHEGDVAFIPTGNNTFNKEVGMVGYEPGELRYVTMRVCLLKQEAGLLLQVKLDGNDWDHRWGIDGRSSYGGAYTYGRRGQTLNVPVGEWVEVQIDLIDELGARPGQIVRGMAFSAADGNMVMDQVGFNSSPPLTACLPPAEGIGDVVSTLILSNEADNSYSWKNGSPYVTKQAIYEGDAAFIANGNNSIEQTLGTIGNEANEFRYLVLQVCLFREEAGMLLQVKVENDWNYRWGLDGRSNYGGAYTYGRKGQSPNLPVGEWLEIKIDLIEDLGARPGQVVKGLAFSAADGNMVYDYVGFSSSE